MRKFVFLFLLPLSILLSCTTKKPKDAFVISDSTKTSIIYVAQDADSLIQWAAGELSNDIEKMTGKKPEIIKTDSPQGTGIYIGQLTDALL